MAIGATLLTSSGDNTDASAYATASVSPAADSLMLLMVADTILSGFSPMAVPTSAHGTWVHWGTRTWGTGLTARRVSIWTLQCDASPGSGAITLTETDMGSGTTATSCGWSVVEVTGHHVDYPIRQVAHPLYQDVTVTSHSINLSSPVDANSRAFAFFLNVAGFSFTERASWTELADTQMTAPSQQHQTQWRSDAFETTASATVANSGTHGVAIEIAEAAAADDPRALIMSRAATAATTSPVTVNMPSGIEAGDLLVAAVATDVAATVAAGGGEGWTQVDSAVNGAVVRVTILAKVAAGGDALTLTIGSADDSAVHVMRIVNHGVSSVATDIEIGTAATGTDAAPDPPSATPAASAANLFIAVAASDDDDDIYPFWPTSYTAEGQQQSASSATSCLIQVAYRYVTTGSAEDPPAFILASSEEWVTQTIVVPPAAPSSNQDINATVVTITVEIPSAVVESSGAASATITIPVEFPAVTVTADATINATTVTIPIEIPTAIVSLDIRPNPVVIPIVIPTATISQSNTIQPSAVTIPVQIPPVTLTATGPVNASITPLPVTVKAVIPVPTIAGTGTVSSALTYPVPSRIARATGERSLANL